jgi:hypothetical protein
VVDVAAQQALVAVEGVEAVALAGELLEAPRLRIGRAAGRAVPQLTRRGRAVGRDAFAAPVDPAVAARQLKKPALVNIFEGGKTPVLPARELEAMGYRIGIYPSQTHRAAIAAAKRVLAVLKRDGDTAAIESELATFNDREEAVNSRHWRELETKYLKDV